MSETFQDKLITARQAVEQGDIDGAYRELRWAFLQRELAFEDIALAEALCLLSPVVRTLAGAPTAELVEATAAAADDPQRLYDLGYHLLELGAPEAACSVLTRANALAPGQETVLCELVTALERLGHNAEACALLSAAPEPIQQRPLCRYLLAFNSVMSADLERARELLPALQHAAEEDGALAPMARRIAAMLGRADLVQGVCPLDEQDLRGWHFVTTGGLLLLRSPYGADEGMNGRYAFIGDSFELCRQALRRLGAVLVTLGEKPPWIFATPDRDSQILAAAAEEVLGLPVVEYEPDAGPGLIMTYDLSRLDENTPTEIFEHAPSQILFSHGTCWTEPPPCAPDITSLLYQSLQSPWGERMEIGADGGVQTLPADTGLEEDIAARIVEVEGQDEQLEAFDPLEALLALTRVVADQLAYRAESGSRSPLWEGGPVGSSRFL